MEEAMTVPIRVMIVDDDPIVRRLLTLIFEDAGSDIDVVAEADGAEAAMREIDAADPDVVTVDFFMPVADGFETARQIRVRRPDQLIVLCSGTLDFASREIGDESGIAAFVSKDDYLQLPSVLRELIGTQPDGASRA